jgi:hypothetical protein
VLGVGQIGRTKVRAQLLLPEELPDSLVHNDLVKRFDR